MERLHLDVRFQNHYCTVSAECHLNRIIVVDAVYKIKQVFLSECKPIEVGGDVCFTVLCKADVKVLQTTCICILLLVGAEGRGREKVKMIAQE